MFIFAIQNLVDNIFKVADFGDRKNAESSSFILCYFQQTNIEKCPFTYWLNGRWFLQIVDRDSGNFSGGGGGGEISGDLALFIEINPLGNWNISIRFHSNSRVAISIQPTHINWWYILSRDTFWHG